MPLFKNKLETKNEKTASRSDGQQESFRFFSTVIEYLLNSTKELIVEIKEKDLSTLQELTQSFIQEIKQQYTTKESCEHFEQYKKQTDQFIKIHKDTTQEKEKELRDIIDLLSKAISTFDNENKNYYQSLFKQSEKLEELRKLDDIRTIKTNLKNEITSLRSSLEKKKIKDFQSLEKLSNEVIVLKNELERVREENQIDRLTGAYNRHAFDYKIQSMIKQANQTKKSFTMIVFDIDYFKTINDNHGHQYGDRALAGVVAQTRQYIREEDFLARYGGDEFVIILPNTPLKVGIKKAQTICQAVEKTKYVAEGNLPPIDLTLSMGVSAFRKNDTHESLFERADKALYLTKQRGRNAVHSEKDL